MLVRPSQLEGESPAGHQWRLAKANGLNRAGWLPGIQTLKLHARRRICPGCLGSPNGIWRADWEHGLPVCAVHRSWLLDQCPNCATQFTLASLRSLGCKCGMEFHAMRIFCRPGALEPMPFLQDMSQEGVMWLGTLDRHGLHGKPGKKLHNLDVTLQVDHLQRGAEIARNWPQAFHALLDRLRVNTTNQAVVSLFNDAFPGLAMRIRRLKDPSWQRKIDLALQAYVAQSAQTAHPIIGRNVRNATMLKQVSASVGVGVKRAKSLLSFRDDRCIRVTKAGRKREVTTRDVLGQELVRVTSCMSLTAARHQLGMSMARFRNLCAARNIPIKAGRVEGRLVISLRDQILASQTMSIVPQDAAIIWSDVLRMHVTVDRTAEWIDAVIAGNMRIFGSHGAEGIAQSVFDRREVLDWVSQRSSRLNTDMLSLVDAAKFLGVKQEVIYHLVNARYLRVTQGKQLRRAARFVEGSELGRFCSLYQSLAAFARTSGISVNTASAQINSKGITPVIGPTVDGCRQYFFLRHQIKNLNRLFKTE